MDWARILAYMTGTVDQELLLRNEYLASENRILKAQLKMPLRLTDAERMAKANSDWGYDRIVGAMAPTMRSNLRAISRRYHPSRVSGFTTLATSSC
jgi:hypothetical protein